MADGAPPPSGNRLAGETSPYLLQHADNPVAWLPWGDEAFERAREEDRPILLSIGYSSCHWCHVMERESFEDDATADVMNASFVSVKVDREERPDVDSVYMRAVQAMTGQGGWPLTVFLTPDGVPFYGGTYFPPEPRHGMPSFRQVLDAAASAWRDRKEDVERAAGEIRSLLERAAAGDEAPAGGPVQGPPDAAFLDGAFRALASSHDPAHGGFGRAPKFPQPTSLELLLHHHARTGDDTALAMALRALRGMARGGIRDHLAGGFHRYAVDDRWLVPHFEKMLYDNALLSRVYLAGWQLSGDGALLAVVEETLGWLLADMRSPEGGFYAARDADSEGEEGRYYVWTKDEVEAALGKVAARLFGRVYDVSAGGNWEGRNILHLPHDPAAVARSEETAPEELERRLADSRAELLAVRARREAPFRDDKVLAGWNGMALRAFAEAGGVTGRRAWLEAATDGLGFVLSEMRRGDRLLHTWKDGDARVGAFLEDYAAVGNALLTAHEVTLDPAWLAEARWCAEKVLELFWDDGAGLFHDTASDAEALVVRPRETMDHATPSGSSLAAELLQRAGRLFGEAGWEAVVERVLAREAPVAARHPLGFGRLLSVASRRLLPPVEVAVVGPRGDDSTAALVRAALRPWVPQRVVTGGEPGEALPFPAPLLEARGLRDGRPAAYVCSGYACREPAVEPLTVEAQVREVGGGGR